MSYVKRRGAKESTLPETTCSSRRRRGVRRRKKNTAPIREKATEKKGVNGGAGSRGTAGRIWPQKGNRIEAEKKDTHLALQEGEGRTGLYGGVKR